MRRFQITACLFAYFAMLSMAVYPTSGQESNAAAEPSTWFGTLELGAIKLRLQLDLTTDDDGKLTAVITSLDQGNAKIPMDHVAMEDGKLTFDSARIQCAYEGTKKSDEVFEGTFTQFGQKTPLKLQLVTDPEALQPNRPQHPAEPYPYDAKEVTFSNEDEDSVTLAGTLTIPKQGGPFPAVLLVTGSGPQDRDESLMGHKPFLVLADHLTRLGIAVLRYDDRGFGKSTGSFGKATSEDFAGDAAAGIAFLARHEKVDSQRIGLIGHSEGGLIGGMLAAKNEQLAHVILLAGPGIAGDEIIRTQTAALSEAAGAAADSDDVKMVAEVMEALKSEASTDEILAIADKYLSDDQEQAADSEDVEAGKAASEDREAAEQTASQQAAAAKRIAMTQFTSPWFRYFVKYDPQPDLAKAKCPVLAMNGSKDLQVLVDLNLPAIEKALSSAPVQGHRIERLEGLNHLFQTAETGLPGEYGTIEETMSPRALEMIAAWILAH